MKNKKLRQILETKRAIKTILTLYEKKRMPSNELAKIIGGSRSTPQKRFKAYIQLDIMKREAIFDSKTDRVLVMYSLTKKGEDIARKLSYVFDDKKEVVVLPKTKYDILQKMLEQLGEGTVDEFVLGSVLEKIERHKGLKRGGRQRTD